MNPAARLIFYLFRRKIALKALSVSLRPHRECRFWQAAALARCRRTSPQSAVPPTPQPFGKADKVVRGSILGSTALSDCFMAETAIFSTLSTLKSLRSDLLQRTGTKRSIPISTSFSTSHSIRSECFVGATATVIEGFHTLGRSIRSTISTAAAFGWSPTRRHLYSPHDRRRLPTRRRHAAGAL